MASAIWTIGDSTHAYSTSWWCAAMPLMTFIGRLWRAAIWAPMRGVRPLQLVVDRLADVVQQAAHLGDLDVGANLGSDRWPPAWPSRSSASSTFWP